jgi:NIF3 (NGG1p interacting factor 3)
LRCEPFPNARRGDEATRMSVPLRELLSYLDTELRSAAFRDYAPNGLQVEGRAEVARVITGVSASAALLEAAIERKAELVIVHHGLIWGGGIARVEGPMARRLKLLLANELSLAAYHLPLDAHARLGNNAGLADAIGLAAEERSWFGDVRGHALGLAAGWASDVGDVRDDGSLSLDEALARIGAGVCAGAAPRFVFPFGPRRVRRAVHRRRLRSAGGCRARWLRSVRHRRAGRARWRSRARAADHPRRRRSLRHGDFRADADR